MSFKNINIQSNIRRSTKNIEPLVLEVKNDYYTACPNPIEVVINVISGKVREHSFRWAIISGSSGRFVPNSRSLLVTFDPLGKKDRRKIKLIVDEGKPEEQIFVLELYDNAISYNNSNIESESSFLNYYNEKFRSCNTIDMNISDDPPPLSNSVQILRLTESGKIIYPNSDIFKVELYRYPNYDPIHEVYYPDRVINNIVDYQDIVAKTYYKQGIKTLMFWDFVSVININTGNIVRIAVQDNNECTVSSNTSYYYRSIGSGTRILKNVDMADTNIISGSSFRNITINNNTETKNSANNSPRIKLSNSSSTIFKKINYRTGIVG